MVLLMGLVVWLAIVAAESLHGVARVLLLEPLIGDLRARQVSVFTGSAIVLLIAMLFARWVRAESIHQLIGVGLLWVFLMLVFEISLGRLVMGYSWEQLVERSASDYNILEGGLLSIGMAVLFLAPLLAAKARRVL